MKLRSLLLAVGLMAVATSAATGAYQLSAQPIWRLAPGDREYLTYRPSGGSGGYYERGLAYNPVTGNVLLTHFNHDTDTLIVPILDGETGAHLGELSTEGITGGLRRLRMIAITEDGIIFGANLSTPTSRPYKIYRWDNETAVPVVVWEGDPSEGFAHGDRHFGHNLTARGTAGGTIEILTIGNFGDGLSQVTALFTSTDGGNTFTLNQIETQPTQRMNLGAAFGEGGTFWGSRAAQPLYELDFEGNILRTFGAEVIDNMISPIAIDLERRFLAVIGSWQPHLRLYNLDTLSTTQSNAPLVSRAFPSPNDNVERTGAVAIGPHAVYAMDTNNGIIAYGLVPPPPEDPNLAWQVLPGTRSYVTGDNNERGLAHNPVTDTVYLTHWSGTAPVVAKLDGQTGQHLGTLSVDGISGGFRSLRMIGVTDDGMVFGGNQTTDSASDPFRLYRWDNESAEPVGVWQGDPTAGVPGVIRGYGVNLAVRGGGDNVEVIIAPDWWQQVTEPHVVGRLVSTDGGQTFTLDQIVTQPTTRFGLGLDFGEGNTFWGSRAGQPLREFDFSGNLLREFGGDVLPSGISPIGINHATGHLVGILPGEVRVYDLTTLSTTELNLPLASQAFPTSNPNIDRTGAVAFGSDGLIYALDTNNGVIAWKPAFAPEPVEPGDVFWTNQSAVRTGDLDTGETRTMADELNRAIGVAVDTTHGLVFWAEDAGARVWRANLDGTEATVIVSFETVGGTGGQFLDVNPSLRKVYWAEWTKGLFSATYDGEEVTNIISHAEVNSSMYTGVTVNRRSGEVYLGSATGRVWRVDADGANLAEVVALEADTYGIAVDPRSNRLYYTNFSLGTLKYRNLDTMVETTVFSGLGQPLGIAVGEDGDRLYWVERIDGRVMTVSMSPTGTGTAQVVVTGENSPFGVAARTEPAPTGFAGWIARFDLPTDQQGPADDPDGDGLPNVLEYALGLNPTVADVSGLPTFSTVTDNGQDFLVLTVERQGRAEGIDYIVEVSDDLVQWRSGPEHTTGITDTENLLVVRDNTPTDAQRRFIRLRVDMR